MRNSFPASFLKIVATGALAMAMASAQAATGKEVVTHYADIAHAVYEDSLTTAKTLQIAVEQLTANPTQATLEKARASWKAARVPYQQSEVFRFGNAIVDEWEGQVNAWPLDEGLVDYVAKGYQPELGNEAGNLNIIANTTLDMGGETLDLRTITPDLLAGLNELAGSEANVATGYHAIEFLLWGQDLNGTKPGAGNRPHTDFVPGKGCTGGHCERRAAYLKAVTQLLVDDLAYMTSQWSPGKADNYRAQLLAGNPREGLNKMLFGMGSLALGELAGERMKVALEANSPEDEHDCFSDNTHHSHFYNAQGIRNVYEGRYTRVNGKTLSGPSLADLIAAKDPELAKAIAKAFADTTARLQVMVDRAEAGLTFDQMIAEGNKEGEAIISAAINALVSETRQIEKLAVALGINGLNPNTADHEF